MYQALFTPSFLFIPPAPVIDDRDLFIQSIVGTKGCTTCPPGPEGPAGPPGPSGSCGPLSGTIITENYEASGSECYIGARLEDEATLTLPANPTEYTNFIIKLEFGPPVGNRKLKIESADGDLINGNASVTLTTPYQSIRLIYSGGEWFTI